MCSELENNNSYMRWDDRAKAFGERELQILWTTFPTAHCSNNNNVFWRRMDEHEGKNEGGVGVLFEVLFVRRPPAVMWYKCIKHVRTPYFSHWTLDVRSFNRC